MTVNYCPQCGHQINDEVNFCPTCGFPVSEKLRKNVSGDQEHTLAQNATSAPRPMTPAQPAPVSPLTTRWTDGSPARLMAALPFVGLTMALVAMIVVLFRDTNWFFVRESPMYSFRPEWTPYVYQHYLGILKAPNCWLLIGVLTALPYLVYRAAYRKRPFSAVVMGLVAVLLFAFLVSADKVLLSGSVLDTVMERITNPSGGGMSSFVVPLLAIVAMPIGWLLVRGVLRASYSENADPAARRAASGATCLAVASLCPFVRLAHLLIARNSQNFNLSKLGLVDGIICIAMGALAVAGLCLLVQYAWKHLRKEFPLQIGLSEPMQASLAAFRRRVDAWRPTATQLAAGIALTGIALTILMNLLEMLNTREMFSIYVDGGNEWYYDEALRLKMDDLSDKAYTLQHWCSAGWLLLSVGLAALFRLRRQWMRPLLLGGAMLTLCIVAFKSIMPSADGWDDATWTNWQFFLIPRHYFILTICIVYIASQLFTFADRLKCTRLRGMGLLAMCGAGLLALHLVFCYVFDHFHVIHKEGAELWETKTTINVITTIVTIVLLALVIPLLISLLIRPKAMSEEKHQ